MNTTAAAHKANVTARTIQHWCRYGAVTATKASGRWNINEASLAYRITLGRKTPVDMYEIVEGTDRYDRPTYTVTRTDGTPIEGVGRDWRLYNATYITREQAEVHCEFVNHTPAEYSIAKSQHRTGWHWKISGSRTEDPTPLKAFVDVNEASAGDLIRRATEHAQGAEARITAKAERDIIEAAEAAVREARAAQLDEIRRTKGELATPKQVEYIVQLLAARERSGEGGGFFYGPTDRAGIEEMSKIDASSYITSLKGDY